MIFQGGSTSWSFFFGENNITRTYLADCAITNTCPTNLQLRLLQVSPHCWCYSPHTKHPVQVRHPLERLLATWRHIFKNGGWKSLDSAQASDQAKARMEAEVEKFTWNYFVQEVAGHLQSNSTCRWY